MLEILLEARALPNLRTIVLVNCSTRAGETCGSIPAAIGGCTSLVILDLSGSGFEGGLPNELGNLLNLTHIKLIGNKFSGKLPKELGNLVNLTLFNAAFNQFEGELPLEIIRMKAKGVIPGGQFGCGLRSNKGFTLPSNIGELGDGITKLDLSYCSLIGSESANETEVPLKWCLRPRRLTWFQLDAGELPLSVGRLKANGCSVDLQGNQTFTLSTDIENVSNETKLDFRYCFLEGELPKALGRLTHLTHFDVSHNDIQGDVSNEVFAFLCRLEYFDLSGNPRIHQSTLAGHLACTMKNLKYAKSIDASSKGLTGCLPKNLPTSLELINLHGNSFTISKDDKASLRTKLPECLILF